MERKHCACKRGLKVTPRRRNRCCHPLRTCGQTGTGTMKACSCSVDAAVCPRRRLVARASPRVELLTPSLLRSVNAMENSSAANSAIASNGRSLFPSSLSPLTSKLPLGQQKLVPAPGQTTVMTTALIARATDKTMEEALSQWMAERAVLPIENSLGGSIHAVYDLLLRYRLHIVGETSLAINHCLVALPGTRLADVRRVMSHPQALAQCDGYLRKLGVVKEAVDDTAGAAQMELQGVGAVCSRRAAELYGLDVLEEGVQDVKDNITRFIVLSRDPLLTHETDPRQFKTSVVFSLRQGPGQLFRALSVFALRDIDMTKIESRPLRTNPIVVVKGDGEGPLGEVGGAGQRFNYLFYVDFVGTLADVRCQNALRHLQEFAPFLRVLGTYPMDTELGFTSSDDPLSNGSASLAAAT
ncbi:uncharacterized protein HaLaN_02989 [Haematococcus lacustris]|uniref:Arogenate dehydratase n=1 Tax=Haematococcus lacustris TaxID=44745 RepID=A0A699YF60_HAELA|nr:uncharacterized protein HaLaN_02989 [Haematococcus lacustris]